MTKKILLTSFQTWLPHQLTNSSDDLLIEIQKQHLPSISRTFLRKLPVDVSQASRFVIAKISEVQPDVVICCGMAERYHQLTIESNATCGEDLLTTTVEVEQLVTGLANTKISHDAGKFVCEGLYYEVLKYLKNSQHQSLCIFVHVPILTPENLLKVVTDFQLTIEKLVSLVT